MTTSANDSQALVDPYWDELVDFARRLVQTPSLPGQEADVARLVRAEMEGLGYDEVRVDQAGNVVGTMRGLGGPDLLLDTHMDHVAVGDHSRWPYPPFGAEIHDDSLWGRGTVDIKGPMAAQIYAVAALRRAGYHFQGDVHVAAVVQEEIGGLGTQALLDWLRPSLALIGEPSGNRVARGHRGRVELHATIFGRSVHASMPEQGINPHYGAARFLTALASLPMAREGEFGASSVAPTLYRTDQTSPNVVPSEVVIVLDWRNVPSETPEVIAARVEQVLQSSLDPGSRGRVVVPEQGLPTYTGYERVVSAVFPSFALAQEDRLVRGAQSAVSEALGRDDPVIIWEFATDGGHTAAAGIPTLGFGPGDPRLAHTVTEHLPLEELRAGCAGTIALVRGVNFGR